MYDGMRSALAHLFCTMEVWMDQTFQQLLSQYVKGLKAIVWKSYLNILKINKGLVPAQVNGAVANGRVEEVVGCTVTAI